MIIVRDDGPDCLNENVYCCHFFLPLAIDVPKWKEIEIVSTRIVPTGGLLRIFAKPGFS